MKLDKRETYLTDDEEAAISLLGTVFKLITKICKSEGEYQYDAIEACDKIHQLQHMIMAQAAARAYPEKYRLLGSGSIYTVEEYLGKQTKN